MMLTAKQVKTVSTVFHLHHVDGQVTRRQSNPVYLRVITKPVTNISRTFEKRLLQKLER